MNYLDIIILSVAGVGVAWGVNKGFVKTFAGVVGFFAALFIATALVGTIAQNMQEVLNFGKGTAYVLGYVVLFFAVILIFKLAAHVVLKLFEITSTRWVDRAGGGLFGFVIAGLLLSLVFGILSFFSFTERLLPERQNSFLYPYARNFFPAIYDLSTNVRPAAQTVQDITSEILEEKPREVLEKTEAGRSVLKYIEKLNDETGIKRHK